MKVKNYGKRLFLKTKRTKHVWLIEIEQKSTTVIFAHRGWTAYSGVGSRNLFFNLKCTCILNN